MKHLLYLSKIMGGRPMRQLKRLAALTFALFCCLQTALAYDFSAVSPSGHTLYYTVISGTSGYRVYVAYPNTGEAPWEGYEKPTGDLIVPYYVVNGIISYSVSHIISNAFKNCTGLTSVTIQDNGVNTIFDYAFNGCTGLTEVSIPNSAISIGSTAFSNCPNLTTVNINSNALVSANYSYDASTNGYDNLKTLFGNQVTSYNLGSNVQSIGENAFRGCSGMTSVSMPSALSSIGDNAFRDCSNLYSVDLPDYLNSVGAYAFAECTSLTSVFIPDHVLSIGSYAFFGCSSLTSVTIPSSVTDLGIDAFDECPNMTSVTINSNAIISATTFVRNLKSFFGDFNRSYTLGQGVTSIGAYAFHDCTRMTSVTIPSTLTSIGSYAFFNCNNLSWVKITDMQAWCAIDFADAYANPLYYADHLYLNNNEVTHLYIPVSVSAIEDYAFIGLTGLQSVTIPTSVTSIGVDAFKDCSNLTSVTINSIAIASTNYTRTDNLKSIFGDQVTSYTFGNLVTAIGGNALFNCANMTSVTFLGHVMDIRAFAFSGCSGLTRVNVSDLAAWCLIDFASPGTNPLYYSHHLFNTSNTEITHLAVPSSVSSIGKNAFTGCTGLLSVTIPNSVTSIGSGAFTGCDGLNRVNISDLKAWCEIVFEDGTANPLAKAHHLYLNNAEITHLTIPSDVTSIGKFSFRDCIGLTSVTIHNAVSFIGTSAFSGCTGLTEMHVAASVPPTVSSIYTFNNVPTAIPVYVPLGSVPSYQAAQYWSRFTNYKGVAFPDDLTVTVPYEQEFYQSFIPGKWTSYEGQLVWDGSINKYTANLSTNVDHWYFGFVNGVFLSSHAWANIGNTNHAFWLVSPIMHLDGEYNMLSFDMALTQALGFLTPVTPGAQNHTRIFALVSTDHGLTWTKLEAWRHNTSTYSEIESLTPHATTLEYNLASYADQDIMVGFYVDCSNANDAANRVHIDNFFVGEFDPSTPPTVAVDDITGYTATVSWTPAFAWQQGWDFYYKSEYDGLVPYDDTSLADLQATGRFYHLTETSYALQDLIANRYYQVWVRHRDGSETGSWSSPLGFTTTLQCAPPKNPQVVTTQTTATITWEPGQPNQTSWEIYVDPGWDMGEELEEPFFYMDGLTPGTAFEAHIFGHCTEGDGDSDPLYIEFSTDDYDHLTVNDGNDYNDYVVVIGEECGENANYGNSRSQFIIPAEMLAEMQYSTIQKISFYSGQNGQPWGSSASFQVYMKEVDFFDFDAEGYCDDSFYDWDNLYQFNNTTLRIENGKMTIESGSGFGFHYTNGNLLIGIKQNWVGNNCQVAWYGVGTPNASPAMYEPSGENPQCVPFLPKTTFTYESDHYNPPTEFMAYPTSSNEVYFGWMPCEDATSYEIEVSESPDFGEIYDQHLVGLTGYEYTWVDYDLLEPDNTYYARIRALYQRYGVVYGSSWSESVEFMTLEACPVPTDLTATEVGNLIVELDWTETGDATEWVIAFQADGEIGERYLNTYHHPYYLEAPYLEPGTTYTVRIHPLCPNGGFVFCDPITFITSNNIDFNDQNVKALCVANWDTSGDGELSFAEAAAVTTLGDVFKNKTNITSFNELKFFTGLTTINNNAFYQCSQLRSVIVPNGVTTLESYAFQLCTSLESVTLPTTLTEIKSNAFRNCSALTAIEFPEGLTTIGEYAFYGCTSLFSIFIPASVTTLTNNPFVKTNLSYIYVDPENTVFDSRDDCNAIIKKDNNQLVVGCKNTVVPSTALSIWDYAFRECVGLTSIYIPENIKYIYSYAFFNCSALTSVNIPSQVTKIYLCSFYGCSGLSSITIPSGVTEIQQSAFNGCTGLTEITVLASTPPTIGVTAFAGVDNTIPVYVPCDYMTDYYDINGTGTWGGFTNFIAIDCEQQSEVIALHEGWNWWAPKGEMYFADLGDILDLGRGLIVLSQDEGFARYEDNLWQGTLSEFVPGKMYKIMANEDCTIVVTSTPVSSATVTIEPGFNWIGYTGPAGLSIAEALGSFEPNDGDEIHDEDGVRMASYDGESWEGNLPQLVPGKGYLYYSTATVSKPLIISH